MSAPRRLCIGAGADDESAAIVSVTDLDGRYLGSFANPGGAELARLVIERYNGGAVLAEAIADFQPKGVPAETPAPGGPRGLVVTSIEETSDAEADGASVTSPASSPVPRREIRLWLEGEPFE